MKFATFVLVARAILLVVLFFGYPAFPGWSGDRRSYMDSFFLALCVCAIMTMGRDQKAAEPEKPISRS